MIETKSPKEMLSIRNEFGKTIVRINFSSLDLISTCLRKSYYILDQKLKSENESEALTFGTAIHKALEHWYLLPMSQRELKDKEQAEVLAFGHGLEENYGDTALESIRQFVLAGRALISMPDGDKRGLQNGVKILSAYFKHYATDSLQVYKDDTGPYIERPVAFKIYLSPTLEIEYFGTIDVVLQNSETGVILIADHKTTATLGQQFYSRLKPNHQYTGYIMAAQKALGLNTNLFMVNGIQVAKTKAEFARQVTDRTQDDFDDLQIAVIRAVTSYLSAKQTVQWPMTAPGPCSSYGNCQFLNVCSSPNKIKNAILSASFKGVSA